MADSTAPTSDRWPRPTARAGRSADRPRGRRNDSVLVIGLGRFGASLAERLDRLGQDVLAAERSPDLVALWSGRVPVVEADCSNPEALAQIGARDFPVAVVGVPTSSPAC